MITKLPKSGGHKATSRGAAIATCRSCPRHGKEVDRERYVRAMSVVLLADIGGSNSRFALANPAGRPERVLVIENDTAASLEAAVTRYLDETGAPARCDVCDRRADRRRRGCADQSRLALPARRFRPALRARVPACGQRFRGH